MPRLLRIVREQLAARGLFPETRLGRVTCYIAAVPFFRNTAVSDLLFSAAFFGAGYLVSHRRQEKASLAL